ncbi:ATPase [uncultured Megasphaera sp.]|uniref:ATPase n=1 Tax=uncultured Megasphaera sp. TaxID=165188 RepID=UPI002594E5BD|nr:ATPase [uncultured Megasphaera sp.]
MPFTNKKVVSEEEVLQIIDELKETLPEELVQSKQIIAEREKILADAKQHADNMIIQAKDYIAKLTEEHELVRQAQERAQQILVQANASSEELKGSSITYAGDVLKYVETTLEKTLFSIQQNRESLLKSNKKDSHRE